MSSFLKNVEEKLFGLLKGLISLSVVILLLFVTAQIVARYFNISILKPPDEITTLTFAWFVFLGSALLVRDNDHLKIELLEGYFAERPRLKSFYKIIVVILMILFIIVMIKSSLTIYERAGSRTSPMLQLPKRIWYSSIVVSGFLMLFYSTLNLILEIYHLCKK